MKFPNRWRLAPFAAAVAAAFPLLASANPAYVVKVPAVSLKVQPDTVAVLSLSTPTLAFGNQLRGATSPIKSVVVTNTGTASTTIGAPTVTGPFAATTNCTATLAAGGSCAVSASFTPTSFGAASGVLSFGTGVGAQTVSLTGAGVDSKVLDLVGVTGNAAVLSASVGIPATQVVTLKNTGTGAVQLSANAALVNSSDPAFALSASTCNAGTTLAASASCQVTVTFTPTTVGNVPGTLRFASDATAGNLNLSLTGTGMGATWALQGTPTTTFGSTAVGAYASPDQTFTLKNTGNAAGNLTIPAFGGTAAGDYSASSNCTNISAGNTCTVTVRFKPLQAGISRNGTLAIGGSTLSYTGTGVAGGVDPYYANVSLLMHFEGADGATGSGAFIDQKGTIFTVRGTPKISTADKAAGSSALYITQANDTSMLYATNSQALVFGTNDFTVEFFWKSTSDGYHQWPINSYTGANGDFNVYRRYNTGGLAMGSTNGVTLDSNTQFAFNSWKHVAISRVSGTTRMFFNGVLVGSVADTTNYTSTNLNIGGLITANGRNINGYLDDIRVTKGVGRYVNPFTPPTGQFPDQ